MEDHQQPVHRDDVRQFHVHTCLGAGGFGEVYKATMTSAGGVRHEVAIKVLHEGLDPRSQAVQRLRDEGKLLGVLRHPAILRVHDLVLLAGRVSLVTEYIEGGDLDDCFGAGNMPLRALIDVCGQVAAALDAAWNTESPDGDGKLKLVHRDVKPANIRVGRHGEVKLLDFGIAKAAGVQREAQTQAKALIGSYLYMSPERLDRKEGFVPEGDVYALGAVLFEGITQERLFGDVDLKEQYKLSWDGGEHDLFIKRKVDAIPDLDDQVRDLLTAALSHSETERPSALEMSQVCEELADSLPGKSLRQWCRARQWPEPGDDLGALGGRTITETSFTTGTISSATLSAMTRPDTTAGGQQVDGATSFGYLDGASTLASNPPEAGEESGGRRKGLVFGFAALVGMGLLGTVALGAGAVAMMGGFGGDGVAAVDEPAPAPAPAPEPDPKPDPATDGEDPGTDGEDPGTDGEDPGTDGEPTAAPAPAPVPVAPTPKPEAPKPAPPAPEPEAPKPAPTPKPQAATGTISLRGSVPVELRGAGSTFKPGSVPAGSYEVWADFGQGMTRASMDMVKVGAGDSVTLKCSSLRHDCQVQ